MAFVGNNTAIVDLNSNRGVDGSVARNVIASGYCEEMENADITTAGVIKKRAGYQQVGQRLKNRCNAIAGSSGTYVYSYEYKVVSEMKVVGACLFNSNCPIWTDHPELLQLRYGATQCVALKLTDANGIPMTGLDTTSIIEVTLLNVGLTPIPLLDSASKAVGVQKFTFCPLDVFGEYIITTKHYYDLLQVSLKTPAYGALTNSIVGNNVSVNLAVGPSMVRLNNLNLETIIQSGLTNPPTYECTLNSLSPVVPGVTYNGWDSARGVGGYGEVSVGAGVNGKLITQTLTLYNLSTAIDGITATPVPRCFPVYLTTYVAGRTSVSENSFTQAGTSLSIWVGPEFLGVPQSMDGVDSYFSLESEDLELVAISEGALHTFGDEAAPSTYLEGAYLTTTVGDAALVGADTYVLSPVVFGNAFTAVGDILKYTYLDNNVILSKDLLVTAVDVGLTKVTVKWDVARYGKAPATLHFDPAVTRYAITRENVTTWFANSTSIPTRTYEYLLNFKDALGYSTYRNLDGAVTSAPYTYITLRTPITLSYPTVIIPAASWTPVSACKEWRDGTVQAYSAYLRTRGGSFDSVATSVPYQSSLVLSSIDDPCLRYDGDIVHTMAFFRPQIISSRSIPGSKGKFGIEQGVNGEKIGKTLEYSFTYSYTDKFGRTLESEPSVASDGKINPKASVDGDDYSELVEFILAPLPQGCFLPYDDNVIERRMKLNAYVRIIDPTTDSQYDYFLYKTQDATFMTSNVIVLGDVSPTFLDSSRVLYSTKNGNNSPAPAVKYLTQCSNHLVGLGSRTYPYVNIGLNKVFEPNGLPLTVNDVTLKDANGNTIGDVHAEQIAAAVVSGAEYGVSGTIGLVTNLDTAYSFKASTPASGIVITYSDSSHLFAVTVPDPTKLTTTKKHKFRVIGSQPLIGLPIDITGASFVYNGTSSKFEAKTKWVNTDISSGLPAALAGKNFMVFKEWTSVVTASSLILTASRSSSGTTAKDDELVLRYYSPTAAPGALPTVGKYYVISGLGTAGNIRRTAKGDTRILSWESDLIFRADTVGTDTIGGTAYSFVVLTPMEILPAVGASPISLRELPVTIGARILDDSASSFTVYQAIDETTLANNFTTALSGFSNPTTEASIVSDLVPTYFASALDIGSYCLLEPSNAQAEKFYASYPAFKGALRIKSYDSVAKKIVVQVPYTSQIFTSVTGTITLTDAYSRLYNLRLMFPTGKLPTSYAYAPGTLNEWTFFHFRGYDYASTAFQISGYFKVTAWDGTWATVSGLPTIDLSRISGLALSYSTLTLNTFLGSKCVYPIPALRAVPEALKDLSAPFFSPDGTITDSAYVQVVKRLGYALNSAYNTHCHVAMQTMRTLDITVGPNEVAVFRPQKDYVKPGTLLETFYSNGTTGYTGFKFTGYDIVAKRVAVEGAGTTGIQFRQDDYPNRIYWSRAPGANVVSNEIQTFKSDFFYNLVTEDDSPITGATAFNNVLLVFKKDSIWRISFNEDDTINPPQRLQSPVGSFSHNNLPSTLDNCYFVHTSGVYTTDGNGSTNIFKLNRLFNEKVDTTPEMLSLTAGHVDHTGKVVYVGVPYNSQYSSAIAPVDGQFCYSYNDGVLGWTVNTHMDAVRFVRHKDEIYFASSRGKVFKMSKQKTLERYRDGDDPIPFALKTRYTNADENVRFKLYRQFIFSFGGDSKFNMSVYYSTNYQTTVTPLETYTMNNYTTEGNQVTYGNGRFLKMLRESFGYRVQNISFIFTDSSYDSDCAIYNVNLEGILEGSKLIDQQRTPGNLKSQKRSRT